ncbi:AraC-like DNA-binding protein [Sinobacterium caligoides]|uniref:AraC-like DNA-binding protein n=1 Tax=Sinobacterium caligoides TaxID=933926 RepID=A0A3N2DFQ7_9GAMM|nr:AraC family transcriptional regulator [Sinobacterium caligoides]ROR98623.1 AraC-like DNA-binding protein [Sinobacterium caligoides]
MTDSPKLQFIPPAFVTALLMPLHSRGVSVETVLEASQLTHLDLEHLSISEYNKLFVAIVDCLGDESGGLLGSSRSPLGTTRMIAYAMLNCHSLHEALQRAIDFNLECREPESRAIEHRLVVNEQENSATIHYRLPEQEGETLYQPAVLSALAIWMRFCGWLVGRQVEVISASCIGDRPVNMAAIQHFLKCPVDFAAETNSLTFSASYLRLPIIRSDKEFEAFLKEAPYRVIIQQVLGEESIVSRIRHILSKDLTNELPGFEGMAARLHLSARTLRRRLEEEGTSYQRIKDHTRRDSAIELLLYSAEPVSEIAILVGFSDASAFHRSFKKWTGVAPGEYRINHLQ